LNPSIIKERGCEEPPGKKRYDYDGIRRVQARARGLPERQNSRHRIAWHARTGDEYEGEECANCGDDPCDSLREGCRRVVWKRGQGNGWRLILEAHINFGEKSLDVGRFVEGSDYRSRETRSGELPATAIDL
jgi:hypothetical protein